MILITGYSGFIGQHLTKKLDELKLPWVGIDIRGNGLFRGDIRNKYDLELMFELYQVKQVVHLGALAGVRRSKLYPGEYISTNILGTQNVVDLCEKYDARLINFSSSSVYGNLKELPAKEDSPKNPISLYGITKLAAEYIVKNSKALAITVRPFTVYGENGRKDEVVYKWIEQIKAEKPITLYGNGDSKRGYVYVEDLVDVLIKLLQNDYWDFKEGDKEILDFNIGGSEVIELKEILNIFLRELPMRISTHQLERPAEDVFEQYADISRAKTFLGFNPQPKFEENIKRIIQTELKNL